jgi:hypothetical protein
MDLDTKTKHQQPNPLHNIKLNWQLWLHQQLQQNSTDLLVKGGRSQEAPSCPLSLGVQAEEGVGPLGSTTRPNHEQAVKLG